MTVKTVVFTDFARGEYGILSPFGAGFMPGGNDYSGYWTGQNVLRNASGELQPRPAEKPYTITGIPNGVLRGMGHGVAAGNAYIWFVVGTAVHRFSLTDFASQAVSAAYAGALGAFTEPVQSVNWDQTSYAFAYAAGMYKLDHVGATVAAVVGGPTAFNCAIYGDRLMAASANILYYSKAGDFETWTAPDGGTITVGDAFNIVSIRTVGDRLALGKDGPANGHWFVLSGIPGYNHTLRHAETGVTPAHHEQTVDTGAGVGYVSDSEGRITVFDGSQINIFPHLKAISASASGFPSQSSAFPLRRRGEWGFVVDTSIDQYRTASGSTTGAFWLYRNGAWTKHTRVAAPTGTVTTGGYSVSVPEWSQVVFGQGGDASTPATFCSFNPYIERPPFPADYSAAIMDPAAVHFTLPEWWAPTTEEVAVKKVIVDFRKWNTADSDPNTFTVAPTPLRVYANPPDGTGSSDGSAATGVTFSEATSAASTAGTQARLVADFVPTWGNGFRVKVSNMRGVAIQKVMVVLYSRPMAGI